MKDGGVEDFDDYVKSVGHAVMSKMLREVFTAEGTPDKLKRFEFRVSFTFGPVPDSADAIVSDVTVMRIGKR